MKKIILLMAMAAMVSSLSFGQRKVEEKDVPAAVKNEIKKRYPDVNASNIKWEKAHKDYVATFESNDANYVVDLNEDGSFHKSRAKVKDHEVPSKMNDYAAKHHPQEKYREVEKITDKEGKVSYSMKVRDKDYHFDQNGNFVKENDKVSVKDKEKVKKDKK